MNYQVVTLEICGKSLDVEVAFNYDADAEDDADMYEIGSLWPVVESHGKESAFSYVPDCDFVAHIIESYVVSQLGAMESQPWKL